MLQDYFRFDTLIKRSSHCYDHPKNKLKIVGLGETIVIDVKVNPELITILKGQKGFLPAYHMDKDHWLTIELDVVIEAKTILNLLDESFSLTK